MKCTPEYPVLSGFCKLELQLSMQADLSCIIPSWDLSIAKTQRCWLSPVC